jgi:galactokinase
MNPLEKFTRTASGLLAECAQQAEQHFASAFGRTAEWVVAAPGRVNVIGEHTDYNDGFVLPMAIERYVVIAAALTTEASEQSHGNAVFHSISLGDSLNVSLDEVAKSEPGNWSNYVKGVLAGFLDLEYNIPSFNAVIHSSIPLAGGLSSRAALEVAVATLLEAILGASIYPTEKALLCQQAEHRFAGVPCGIMDQFCSVFGQENALMLLDCRSQQIQSVAFSASDVTVLITNSNVKHDLAGGEYAERRQQCKTAANCLGVSSLRDTTLAEIEVLSDQMDKTITRRARHVITENTRTLQVADAIRGANWLAAGKLMYASHKSLRDDYEVSCDELDILVELAQNIGVSGGVFGSRMTGGGFGGCTVSLVRTDAVDSVAEALRTLYLEKTGIEPSLFATRPARGAHVIRR